MRTYTAQEIVDTVWMAYGPLGLPRSSRSGTCRYAGPGGTGCAVGVLVSRDVAEAMDRHQVGNVSTFIDRFTRGGGRWVPKPLTEAARAFEPHGRLLLALQQAHDIGRVPGASVGYAVGEPGVLAEAVRAVAAHHGLLDPARHENDDVDARLADLLGEAFRETHDNLIPA